MPVRVRPFFGERLLIRICQGSRSNVLVSFVICVGEALELKPDPETKSCVGSMKPSYDTGVRPAQGVMSEVLPARLRVDALKSSRSQRECWRHRSSIKRRMTKSHVWPPAGNPGADWSCVGFLQACMVSQAPASQSRSILRFRCVRSEVQSA